MDRRRLQVIGIVIAIAALLFWPCVIRAQDARGEIALESPNYKGISPNAPIAPTYHVRNEGGSNGAGLCVISSALCNGMYQGVPDLADGKDSALWRTAKSRPGGYSPDKLTGLIDEVMPDEKYANYITRDPAILDKLSAQGYPIGATMNTGQLYSYAPIHHMISLVHHQKGGYACVVDNNDPGKYHWMPTAEFDRRWIDGGTGWAFIWTRKPGQIGAEPLLIGAACVVVFIVHKRRTS